MNNESIESYLEWIKSQTDRNSADSSMSNIISNSKENKLVLEIMTVFAASYESASSSVNVAEKVNRLMNFKPINVIYDKKSEWRQINFRLWQHKECSSVFKDLDKAFDIDNVDINGMFNKIVFPYYPPIKEDVN